METPCSWGLFLHCCRLTKHWAHRGHSASPQASGGTSVLGHKAHILNLLTFIFELTPRRVLSFGKRTELCYYLHNQGLGTLHPRPRPPQAEMLPSAPAVCSCAALACSLPLATTDPSLWCCLFQNGLLKHVALESGFFSLCET